VAPSGQPLLWRVSKNGAPPVWLFGTIHDAGLPAVQPAVLATLAGAKRFASELGVVTIDDLGHAIRTRKTLSCSYTGLLAAYAAGDLAALEPMLVIPRTAEPMLWARNRRWLPVIERYLADGGGFIAVGLGHMIGDQGLPALLAKAGYAVERASVP